MQHEAYEASPLLKLTVQIECIAAYDDNLLVGTRQGHLLMYSVSLREEDQKHDVQLLRYNKTFSKKPIQQIEVVPELQLLFSLSDGVLYVHDMNIINFPLIYMEPKTKGASVFTLDITRLTSLTGETSVTVRCCVVVKRRLQLYFWKPAKSQLETLMEDISVPDIPRAVCWAAETLCIGYRSEYCLIPLLGDQKELFPTSSSRSLEPCVTRISDTTFALGRDGQSVLINTKGNPEKIKALKWSEPPIELVYDEPYVLALIPDRLEVRTLEPSLSMRSMGDLHKARLLCRCKRGLLYVASISQIWCISAVDISKQRNMLINDKQFQLALQLTHISDESEEDKKLKIDQIQTKYAFDLFANKKFHESMKEFLKLDTDPYDVIRLFPDLLPQPNKPDSNRDSPVTVTNVAKLQDRDLENGLLALIEFLTEVRGKIQQNGKSKDGVDVKNNPKSSAQLLQIIDTTLLKCYLQTNDALVAPLLRLNHCHLGETEKTLKKFQKFSELIILYQTKGQHKKALELLQAQADQSDSSLKGHDRTVQYLQHLGNEHISLIFEFAGWVLEKHPEDGLKIFTEDILEVENLPRPKVLDFLLRNHQSLVISYLEHVVYMWDDTNPFFHNALVHQYKEKVQELSATSVTSAQHVKSKLLTFLEKSNYYTPETVLVHFPYDRLFEERALILGKLGKHQKALAIYVQILGDVNRAIQYCSNVYEKKSEGYEDVYIVLINMLLSPPPDAPFPGVDMHPRGAQPDLETALQLLEQHASRIPPVKALDILPDSVPIHRLRQFLETALHTNLNTRRQTQVLKGLLYADHLQIQELRMQHESQSVVMSEFKFCPVCKKRFGNQSAFVKYSNGDIVHFSCKRS